MEHRRFILYALLAIIAFFLWQAWQKDYPAAPAATQATPPASAVANPNLPPAFAQQPAKTANIPTNTAATPASTSQPVVRVTTDVLDVGIDLQGGNLIDLRLPKYPESVDTPHTPVTLLNNNPNSLYIAQSGLISALGPDTQNGQATFTAERMSYQLSPEQNTLAVNLTWRNDQGITVTKTYTFTRGQYTIHIDYHITNQSTQPWTGQMYVQLKQKPQAATGGLFSLHTYSGAALSSPSEHYEKISFGKLDKENIDRSVQGGWLAMQQRYFLSAFIPPQNQINHYYSRVDADKVYALGYVNPEVNIPPGGKATVSTTLYSGPQITSHLKSLAPYLDLTIDYGLLSPISEGIFWVMKHLYSLIGNWGWAIVLVTLIIKLLFYKLSETSYRSMAKMRKLAPRLQAIKDRYGDDKQKLSQATMELYRKEKVNPVSGCLPMIVQIPFFIALYYVLIESVELRQAPFIFWIRDLSVHDPYYVLPILMGLSMWLQQRLNPAPPDPVQAKVMMFLPVIFTLFFITFPAGLVLYWLVNSCLSILQQWYVLRKYEKAK